MNRDMELVKQLLIGMRDHPLGVVAVRTKESFMLLTARDRNLGHQEGHRAATSLEAPADCTEGELDYHLSLMEDAGLMVRVQKSESALGALHRLSWQGHDYLDQNQETGPPLQG